MFKFYKGWHTQNRLLKNVTESQIFFVRICLIVGNEIKVPLIFFWSFEFLQPVSLFNDNLVLLFVLVYPTFSHEMIHEISHRELVDALLLLELVDKSVPS